MKITIDREAHDLVSAWVRAASPSEIGGIGYVTMVEKGQFHVSKFVLLEQEATAGSVDFEGEAYVEEITQAASENREDELRLSWHSHGNGGVFWSGIDENGIVEYKSLGMPWLLSLVFNDDGDILGRLDIFNSDIIDQIKFKDVDVAINATDAEIELDKKAEEDIKKFIKKPKFSGYTNPNKSQTKDEKKEESAFKRIYDGAWGSAWSDDDNWEDEEDANIIEEMPQYIDKDDFLDPTRYVILEMEYGTKNVEAWEEELFGEVLSLTIEDEDDDEVRILTP